MRQLQITPSITNRETQSLEAYFREIGQLDLITAQEEVLLAQKIRQGDRAALQKLARTNLRFVVSVAKKYQHMGLPLADLISEGNCGLIKAAQRFDETRGFKFISYAVWWIRQSILAALAEHTRMVRLPQNHVNLLTKMNRLAGELEVRLERPPTDEELAELAEVEVAQIEDARYFSGRTSSYDAPLSDEDAYTLLEKLPCPEKDVVSRLTAESVRQDVQALLASLSGEERQVIELSFGFKQLRPLVVPDIAEILGMTVERVRKLKKEALLKLAARRELVRDRLF